MRKIGCGKLVLSGNARSGGLVDYDAVDKWSTAETVNMYLRRKAIRTGMKGTSELGYQPLLSSQGHDMEGSMSLSNLGSMQSTRERPRRDADINPFDRGATFRDERFSSQRICSCKTRKAAVSAGERGR